MPPPYTLRVARPTDNISALLPFYISGLGFKILSQFENHSGFTGAILGHERAPYHLEFTTAEGHTAGRAPSQDNLLVFYIPEASEWHDAVNRMKEAGFQAVKSFNPWWDDKGYTFEDPDGWRVVLQGSEWTE